MENIVAKTECPKEFDIENIVRFTEANKDLEWAAAKFVFLVPSRTDRQVTVNVYESGKIVTTGANTLKRAREYTEKVLKKLDVPEPFDYRVSYIIMSGYVKGIDVIPCAELLRESSFETFESDLMKKIDVKKGAVFLTFHYTAKPVKIVARGPDEKSIRNTIDDVFRICNKS